MQIVTTAAPARRKPRVRLVRLQCTTDPLDRTDMRQLCRVGDFISARIESIVCSILGRPASQKTNFCSLGRGAIGCQVLVPSGPAKVPERPRVPNLTGATRVIIGPRFKRAKIPSCSPLAGAYEAKRYA